MNVFFSRTKSSVGHRLGHTSVMIGGEWSEEQIENYIEGQNDVYFNLERPF